MFVSLFPFIKETLLLVLPTSSLLTLTTLCKEISLFVCKYVSFLLFLITKLHL